VQDLGAVKTLLQLGVGGMLVNVVEELDPLDFLLGGEHDDQVGYGLADHLGVFVVESLEQQLLDLSDHFYTLVFEEVAHLAAHDHSGHLARGDVWGLESEFDEDGECGLLFESFLQLVGCLLDCIRIRNQ